MESKQPENSPLPESIIAGCAILILVGIFSQFQLGNSTEKALQSGDMLAAVAASSKSSPSSSKSSTINHFTRQKEPYLSLTSPFFDFMSAFTAGTPNTAVTATKPTRDNDVLSITAPKPLTPVTDIKGSLVNIFCSQKIGSLRRIVTGSGVIIKENIVLTDAHVGIYPLVADSHANVTCLARTGSPAEATHSVQAIFISPEWIQKHGASITTSYSETGEDDFALLKIKPVSASYKKTLPWLSIQETVPEIGTAILGGAYPANTLQVNGTGSALWSQTEQLTIKNLLTFEGRRGGPTNTDLIQTSLSTIGQQGSSGGVITDLNNNILSLISTVVDDGLSDSRSTSAKKLIHGLTIAGINKSLERHSSGGLLRVLLFGTDSLASYFNTNYRASLTSIISQALSI